MVIKELNQGHGESRQVKIGGAEHSWWGPVRATRPHPPDVAIGTYCSRTSSGYSTLAHYDILAKNKSISGATSTSDPGSSTTSGTKIGLKRD